MTPSIVLVGTLDTRGDEYGYLRERIQNLGGTAVLVDVGVLGEPRIQADVPREEVARAAGANHAELARAGDGRRAMEVMRAGAAGVLAGLHREGRLQGVFEEEPWASLR